MYTQAGECQCHDTVSAHASGAKDFREAALITERQGRNEEAAALFLRCAEAWVNADEPGRAADYLGKSAKLAADIDEDEAAERYIYASTVVVPSGSDSTTNFIKVVGATDVMVQAINFLATTDRLEECMQARHCVVERYCILLQAESIEHSLGRMYLTYCILALARGDYVKADAVYRDEHLQSTVYLHSEECRVEEELLTAFKDLRPDLLSQVQQDRTLRRLETVIVRLAKSLRVPGDDEEDAIPARETPSGTIGDAQARVGALQEKYGSGSRTAAGARPAPPPSSASPLPAPPTAASSSSLSPPNPKPTAKNTPTKSRPPRAAAAAAPLDGDDDLAKDSLFGGARKASPPLAPAAAVEKGGSAEEQEGLSTAVGQKGYHEEPGEADVDLGLGDLEATLEEGAGDDSDDLEAMIEAARREAEALGMGEGEAAGSDEESDEDDIDLT
ncbi:unnamed protein product [Laminaria digitata]